MSIKHLKTILVDDEQDSLEVLKLLLNRFCKQVDIVAHCRSANEAIEKIQLHQPDLLFTDIEMPDKDGFEILKAFKDRNFKVIIATGYEQYALKAIKYSAIDYILKPIEPDDLIHAVKRVEKAFHFKDPRLEHFVHNLDKGKAYVPDKIILPSHKGFKTILLSEIIYIESHSGNYSSMHLINQKTEIITQPLNYFEDLLSSAFFYRIHRSCILNLNKIKSYNRTSGVLYLDQDRKVEVAVRRKADFYKVYKAHLA